MSLTLEDFEIWYRNLRRDQPDLKECTVTGCNNPRDYTRLLGVDTSCAYHRLLFDHWSSELDSRTIAHYMRHQKARRSAFTKWRNKIGKEACDRIVLRMAHEPINWEC